MTTPSARDPGRVFTWTPPITPASKYENREKSHSYVASHQGPLSHGAYRHRGRIPTSQCTEPEEPIRISPDPESAVLNDGPRIPTDSCLGVSEQPSGGAVSATTAGASRTRQYIIEDPQEVADINGADTAEDTIDQLSQQVMTYVEPTRCQHGSMKFSPSPAPLNPAAASITYPDLGQDGPPDDVGSTDCAAMVISPSILAPERDATTSKAHPLTELSANGVWSQGEPSAEQRSSRASPVPGRLDPSQPRGSCDSSVDSHSGSESCYDSRSDSHSGPHDLSDSDGSGRQGDWDYYPESGTEDATEDAQSDSPTSDSDDSSVQGRRKRRNVGHSYTKPKSQPRRGRNSCHNPARAQTGGSHLLGSRRSSPANNRASAVPDTKFEEWPLSDAVLKRITVQGRATFQLQFEWDPCSVEHRPGRAKCNSQSTPRTQKVRLDRRMPVERVGFTQEEDDLLRELKEQNLPWAQVHLRFNEALVGGWRSQGSLQVHYSTKLKNR